MCIRDRTQDGVIERFAADLREAVAYARDHAGQPAVSAALYGGLPGGMTADASVFITAVMRQLLDAQQSVPAPR